VTGLQADYGSMTKLSVADRNPTRSRYSPDIQVVALDAFRSNPWGGCLIDYNLPDGFADMGWRVQHQRVQPRPAVGVMIEFRHLQQLIPHVWDRGITWRSNFLWYDMPRTTLEGLVRHDVAEFRRFDFNALTVLATAIGN
jgi:hypothetical protein